LPRRIIQFTWGNSTMRMFRNLAALTLLAVGVTAAGCSGDEMATSAPQSGTSGSSAVEKVGRGLIWADGELYRTNATPATFRPGQGNFDELYNTGGNGTFADGVEAISEAAPGDQDYNGGRWHVNLLKDDVDPMKYADATSVEDLDLDDFVSTDTYFECPLRP
jgi:hypothetical protein